LVLAIHPDVLASKHSTCLLISKRYRTASTCRRSCGT